MEDPYERATRAARSAERWANVSVWTSGCALVLLVIPLVAVVVAVAWIWLAPR